MQIKNNIDKNNENSRGASYTDVSTKSSVSSEANDIRAARTYLESIHNIDVRVGYLKTELNNLRLQAENITPRYGEGGGGGSRNVHSFENILVKMADLKTDLEDQLSKLLLRKQIALDYVNAVCEINGDYANLLYKRYFQYKSWERICYELSFSYPHIFRIHKKALKTFAEVKHDTK